MDLLTPYYKSRSKSDCFLHVSKEYLSVVACADVLPVDDILGEVGEVASEEAAAWIEAVNLTSIDLRSEDMSAKAEKQVEGDGQACADLLAAFITNEEEKIADATSLKLAWQRQCRPSLLQIGEVLKTT